MTYQSYQDLPSKIEERPYIPYYIWSCKQPRAILHIVHGMSENAVRYDAMAEWFTKHNILVVSHDHIGHGQLAKDLDRLGYFGSNNAGEELSEDLATVIQHVKDRQPQIPYFVLGHSMGAYVVRIFLDKYDDLIDGIVLSGTNSSSPFYQLGTYFAPILNKYHPTDYNYNIHRRLFGTGIAESEFGPVKDLPLWHAPQAGMQHDWPLIGFVFTNNGFAELVKMAHQATKIGWASNIQLNLPILIMNGRQDPLTRNGKEISKLANELKSMDFKNVTIQTYYNRGHEIFFYSHTDEVYNDLLNWLNRQIKRL